MNPILILALAAFFVLLVAFHHHSADEVNKNMPYQQPADLTQEGALVQAIEEHNKKLGGGFAAYMQDSAGDNQNNQNNQNITGTTGVPSYLKHGSQNTYQIPQDVYQNAPTSTTYQAPQNTYQAPRNAYQNIAVPYRVPQVPLQTTAPAPSPQQQQESYYPPLAPPTQ